MLLSCSQLFPSKLTFTKMDTPPAPKGLLPVPSAPVAHLDTYSLMHSHEFQCYSHTCFSIMVSYHVLFGLIHIPSWTGATSAVSRPAVPSPCGFAVEAAGVEAIEGGGASCQQTSPTRTRIKTKNRWVLLYDMFMCMYMCVSIYIYIHVDTWSLSHASCSPKTW